MEVLFYIIEFAMFAAAIALIIYCIKGESSMKKVIKTVLGSSVGTGILAGILVAVILILCYGLSWLVTCGIIKLITLCFGWTFKWGVATGIWLLICLIKPIFSHTVNVKK